MSDENFYSTSSTKFLINAVEKQVPPQECIDELEEGLKSCITLMAIFDILPYLILTSILFITIPILSPVGIIRILLIIARSFQNLQKLSRA